MTYSLGHGRLHSPAGNPAADPLRLPPTRTWRGAGMFAWDMLTTAGEEWAWEEERPWWGPAAVPLMLGVSRSLRSAEQEKS